MSAGQSSVPLWRHLCAGAQMRTDHMKMYLSADGIPSPSYALYAEYHDSEWGVPCHEDRMLFELLTLEGAQAGLSWITVLRKRMNYRQRFNDFDIERIARFDLQDIERLMTDPGIIRNRAKIESTIANARAVCHLHEAGKSLDQLLWSYVNGQPVVNHWNELNAVPATTPTAEKMSRELKSLGFQFVGPKVMYAFMQASGMVNDHVTSCFRHDELAFS